MIDVRPVTVAAALFGIGVIIGSKADVPALIWILCGAAILLGWLILLLRRSPQTRAAFLAALLFLGAGHVSAALEARPVLETRYDTSICATIADQPVVESDIERMQCRLTDITVDGVPLKYEVRLYLRGDAAILSGIEYGQKITLTGHLRAGEMPMNPGEFDFGRYLWRDGLAGYVTAQLSDASFEPAPSSLKGRFYAFRSALAEQIDTLFPKSSALVRALVLGDRSSMDDELRDAFSKAGVAHLLAISGMHVTLLAAALAYLLGRFLPRSVTFPITVALLLLYGAIAGFSSSIIRAIVMFCVLGYAPLAGRMPDPFTRLSVAFFGMLIFNPLYISDAGFVLSFSAAGGLICLTPVMNRLMQPLERLLSARSNIFPVRIAARMGSYLLSLFCASLAAQLATLPAVIAYYGTLPLLATLTNIFAIPLTMAGLALALAALLLACLSQSLGVFVAVVPDLVLQTLAWVTEKGALLPFSEFRLGRFPGLLSILYVALLVLISNLSRLRTRTRLILTGTLPVIAALAVGFSALSSLGLSVLFFSAGQADCALLTAQGHHYLIDAGLEDTPAADYLDREGIELDAIFLSHPHVDHTGGLAAVLEITKPARLYIPAGWNSVEADDGVAEAIELARSMGIEIIELAAGDMIPLGGDIYADVLHPPRDYDADSANSISMLLHVQNGDGSVLFTGDLPMNDEPTDTPDADVLKVAHHGAANSTGLWQLAGATPSVAVVQVGKNNYGHPSPETVARLKDVGAEIYCTDEYGAVRTRILSNGTVLIETETIPATRTEESNELE